MPVHIHRIKNEIPQLQEICNPEQLQARLYAALTAGGKRQFTLEKAEIQEIRHEAKGGGCKLTLRIWIQSEGGARKDVLYFGWQPRNWEERHRVLERFHPGKMVAPDWGPPQLIIPEWQLILWAFPNDPDLPGLPLLADAKAMSEYLQTMPGNFASPPSPDRVDSKMVKYAPHKRAIFRVQIRSAAETKSVTCYAKAYSGKKAEAAFHIMQRLWETPQRKRGEFLMPQPLRVDRAAKVLWQAELPGKPLSRAYQKISDWTEVAAQIGKSLAALHNVKADFPKELDHLQQCRRIEKYGKNLCRAYPDQRKRIKELVQRLLTKAGELDASHCVPVHGSFKFAHVFYGDSGIGFIDFDGVCHGHPGEDLGRFIAYLHQMMIEEKLSQDQGEKIIARFVEGYNQHVARPLSPMDVDWYTASHLLVSHLHKSVKRGIPLQSEQIFARAMKMCGEPHRS